MQAATRTLSLASHALPLVLRQPVRSNSACLAVHLHRGAACSLASGARPKYETIRSDADGGAGIITIAKPKALNALSSQVLAI